MDTIGDMLIRIKNAMMAGHERADVPYSKARMAVANVLHRENFIESLDKKGKGVKKRIEIELKRDNGLRDLRRVSKPGRRIYRSYREIYPVKQGYGIAIISTPDGIISDKEARKRKKGGEVMAEAW